MRHLFLSALLLVAISMNGCATRSSTFFDDLGGTPGITAIVDQFLVELANDELIVHHFRRTNVVRLREMLILQFCELSGGPCEYTGDTMAMAHRGLGITDAGFNALVTDLIEAMEHVGTPVRAQNRLLAKLAPMYTEIMAEQDIDPL